MASGVHPCPYPAGGEPMDGDVSGTPTGGHELTPLPLAPPLQHVPDGISICLQKGVAQCPQRVHVSSAWQQGQGRGDSPPQQHCCPQPASTGGKSWDHSPRATETVVSGAWEGTGEERPWAPPLPADPLVAWGCSRTLASSGEGRLGQDGTT